MKTNLLALAIGAIALPNLLHAQATRTTINNGLATNPLIWDCTCVPTAGDNIVVNHNVTLNTDFAYGSGSITVNASGSLVGDVATRALAVAGSGTFTNNSTTTLGNFYFGGATMTNNGTFNINDDFAVDLTGSVTNNGDMFITDTAFINTNGIVINAGMFDYNVIANAGTFTNTSAVMGNDILNSGTFNNNGGFGVQATGFYSAGTFNNSAKMTLSTDLWNSETATNNNHIVITNDFWNGDTLAGTATFTNNGTISVGHDLNNSQTMNGSGDYCIANASNNAGSVTGTLDICDLTGTDFDVNVGTVAGTVTNCSGGACALGINENEFATAIVYPNPSNGLFTFSLPMGVNYELNVFNGLGKLVYSNSFNTAVKTIDLTTLPSGIYSYSILANNVVLSGNLVKE